MSVHIIAETGAITAVDIHAAPAEIRAQRQWAVRRAKVPYIAGTDRKAKSTDPATWRSFEEARAAVEDGKADGLYYALRQSSRIVGIDLDHCVTDGVIEPWAMAYVRLLGSYTCLSASGTGLRILVRAEKRSARCKQGPVECYDRDRFLSITDQHIAGTPTTIEARQAELEAFEQLAFPEPKPTPKAETARRLAEAADLGDDERFAAAMRDERFVRLHAGDITGYPSQSEARLAYLNRAAFYSGRSEMLMDRWFRASALDRAKWDRLGAREIGKALDGCNDSYDPSYRSERLHIWPTMEAPEPGPANGSCSAHCARHLSVIETQQKVIAELRAEVKRLRSGDQASGKRLGELKKFRQTSAFSGKRKDGIEAIGFVVEQARQRGASSARIWLGDREAKKEGRDPGGLAGAAGASPKTMGDLIDLLRDARRAYPELVPWQFKTRKDEHGVPRIEVHFDAGATLEQDLARFAEVPRAVAKRPEPLRCPDCPRAKLRVTKACKSCGQVVAEYDETPPRLESPVQTLDRGATPSPASVDDVSNCTPDGQGPPLSKPGTRADDGPPLIDPADVFEVARRRGWPRVELPHVTVGGSEEGWERFCAFPPPFLPEVAAVLSSTHNQRGP